MHLMDEEESLSFNKMVVEWLCSAQLPFNIIEDPELLKLFKKVNEAKKEVQWVSRERLEELMEEPR